MVAAAGREPTETCGQTIWGSRLWCPAPCKPRAAHNSLLRRALLNLQPAVETPVLAAHGWPQLIPSADPAWGAVRKAAYGGGARVSLELGPGSSPGCLHVAGWQEQSKAAVTAALFAVGMLCRSASGLATSLFLMD